MPSLAPSAPPIGLVVAEVAERRRAAEHDRRRRCDATSVFERLAVAARREGVAHPVAAAVARGVRMHHLATPEALSARLGVDVALLVAAEAGEIAFGSAPAARWSARVARGRRAGTGRSRLHRSRDAARGVTAGAFISRSVVRHAT